MSSSPSSPGPKPETSLTEGLPPTQKPPKRLIHSFSFWAVVAIALAVLIPMTYRDGAGAAFFSVITFLEVILLFNILIIVHELGHFLAARWCGLKVDKFAIWFGQPLFSTKIDGIEYVLGTIPAGGYVALPQMAPMEAIEGKSETPREELPPASPWQKIVVAFAGPLFSFLLALVFGVMVWIVGKPVTSSEATTTIGFVEPGHPADLAGLKAGDRILSIDGHHIHTFFGMGDSVVWRIVSSTADTIPVVVKRGHDVLTLSVSPEKDPDHDHHWYDRGSTRKVGIAPLEDVVIDTMVPNSPALMAGLKPGDHLVQMNGLPLLSSSAIEQQLKDHPDAPIHFRYLRDGVSMDANVIPEMPLSPNPIPKDAVLMSVRIGLAGFDPGVVKLAHDNPWKQVRESVHAVTGTIAALFASHSNIGPSQLSGPVGIMTILFRVLSSDNGWRLALWFAVLINVNLAILNLLPLPVLDGGHIALSLIEWVRRRPLSMAILEPLQTACALVIIGYMVFITFYDVQDSGRMALSGGDEIKFAPKH